MRVVVCNSFAPLDQLAIEDRPDLGAGPGQVVIDVEAAGANFVDALLVQGLYQIKPPLPFVPGMEVAGTVRSVGDGVDTVVAGDRVMGMSFFGGYASQVVLPAACDDPDTRRVDRGTGRGVGAELRDHVVRAHPSYDDRGRGVGRGARRRWWDRTGDRGSRQGARRAGGRVRVVDGEARGRGRGGRGRDDCVRRRRVSI